MNFLRIRHSWTPRWDLYLFPELKYCSDDARRRTINELKFKPMRYPAFWAVYLGAIVLVICLLFGLKSIMGKDVAVSVSLCVAFFIAPITRMWEAHFIRKHIRAESDES